jgi:hypothetical protein
MKKEKRGRQSPAERLYPARDIDVRTRLWRTRFERIKSTKARECLGVNVLVNSKRDQIKANQSFKT